MNYRWHSGALDDLYEACFFYFREDPLIEERLASIIEDAIDDIVARPESWPFISEPVRRRVIDVFPYSILYVVLESHVLMLAVAHHSRHPDYWVDRLG